MSARSNKKKEKRREEFEVIHKALGNVRRLHILEKLQAEGEMNVSDIAHIIKLSFRATSRHLHILYSAGLIVRRQMDTSVLYRLPNVPTGMLQGVLDGLK